MRLLFFVCLPILLSSCVSLPKSKNTLVDLSTLSKTIQFDLRYATENNRLGIRLYDASRCYLRTGTARKLLEVQKDLEKRKLRLKIWDAYRPWSVQKILWDKIHDLRYVSEPSKGSDHNRGAAVDLTLTDWEGRELSMGTPFDYMSRAAWVDFQGLKEEEKENRKILHKTMVEHGFVELPTEWWHFYDSEWEQYPILDVPISKVER